ncbi:MAG: hypothetical protein LBT98_04070 [Puniceicoccales bacterium]|nr:hypothetical protein [Puniceicoccales bacterium]
MNSTHCYDGNDLAQVPANLPREPLPDTAPVQLVNIEGKTYAVGQSPGQAGMDIDGKWGVIISPDRPHLGGLFLGPPELFGNDLRRIGEEPGNIWFTDDTTEMAWGIVSDWYNFKNGNILRVVDDSGMVKYVRLGVEEGNYAFDGQNFQRVTAANQAMLTWDAKPCLPALSPADTGRAVRDQRGVVVQLGTRRWNSYILPDGPNGGNPMPVTEDPSCWHETGALGHGPLPNGWIRIFDLWRREFYYVDTVNNRVTDLRPEPNGQVPTAEVAAVGKDAPPEELFKFNKFTPSGTGRRLDRIRALDLAPAMAEKNPATAGENSFHRDLSSYSIRDPGRAGAKDFTEWHAIALDTMDSVALLLSASTITGDTSLANALGIQGRALEFFQRIHHFVLHSLNFPEEACSEISSALVNILPGHSPGSLRGEVRDFTKCNSYKSCCLSQLECIIQLIPQSFDGACPVAEEIRTSLMLQVFAWFEGGVLSWQRPQDPWIGELRNFMDENRQNTVGIHGISGQRQNLQFDMWRHEYGMESLAVALGNSLCDYLESLGLGQLTNQLIVSAMEQKLTQSLTPDAHNNRRGGGLGKSKFEGKNSKIVNREFLDRSVDRSGSRTDICQSRCSDISQAIPLELARTMGPGGERITNLMNVLREQRVCESDDAPSVFPCYGQVPSPVIHLINNPIQFLREAMAEFGGMTKEAYQNFELCIFPCKYNLRNALLKTEFFDNYSETLHLQYMVQLTDKDVYEPRSTPGDIIRSVGLSTVTSMSGTSRDILAAYHSLWGSTRMRTIFAPLVHFVNADCDFTKQSLDEDFKKIFIQTVLQFKAGNFHSSGEILASFYFSTLKMFPDLPPDRSSFLPDQLYIENIYRNLEKLLIAFREHPEEFYPMDEPTKEIFRKSVAGTVQNVQKLHWQNLEERKSRGRLMGNV